jgi:hypothetical protein
MRKVILFVAPIFPMLSGCAGWVIFGHTIGQGDSTPQQQSAPQALAPTAAPAAAQLRSATSAPDPKLRAVTLAFTSEAKEKINADPRFNGDALLAAIHADLQSHALLDDNGDAHSDRSVEIVIDDFATRPTSNAIVFGYVLSNATLSGNIEVRDATGRELRTFNIKADSRLAAPADGEQGQPLGPLYRRFADLAVSELTGVPIKAPDNSNTEVPR